MMSLTEFPRHDTRRAIVTALVGRAVCPAAAVGRAVCPAVCRAVGPAVVGALVMRGCLHPLGHATTCPDGHGVPDEDLPDLHVTSAAALDAAASSSSSVPSVVRRIFGMRALLRWEMGTNIAHGVVVLVCS